ncbi:MAG: response regulator [Pseudomonadota bacterium]
MATNVLLADDEKGILSVLTIYLQDAGYTVFTVDNGQKAADLIDTALNNTNLTDKTLPDKNWFDIVLTDIRMPGMDGISLLKHIKKRTPATEVILITGHGDLKLAIESLKLDAVDFISKPIDPNILDIALKRAMDRINTRKEIENYARNLETLVDEKTKKLADSEKKYIQLFNELPSYITIQDKNLNIIETNKTFKKDFSFQDGMTCYKVYKDRTSPCPDCPVIKTFADGQSHTAEMEIIRKDSTPRNIFIQTSAITDDQGRIMSVMEMSTDVTMIHELQDHLAALGLHISSISHGLKQVLTGLDGGSYLIESGLKKDNCPQIDQGWQIVKEKMSKTRQMVLDILYHSKKRALEKTSVPVHELIREVVTSVQPKADQANILIKIDPPDNSLSICIDKMSIVNALTCVLENAIDACTANTANTSPEVRFSTRQEKSDILFLIKDTGIGISEDKKDKIFNLFYSEKGNKGTGLGLFIAQRSIKQHNGTITVNSKPNQYTQFIITLPLGPTQK